MTFRDLFVKLWTNFIYLFRCFDLNRKPTYQNTNVEEEDVLIGTKI